MSESRNDGTAADGMTGTGAEVETATGERRRPDDGLLHLVCGYCYPPEAAVTVEGDLAVAVPVGAVAACGWVMDPDVITDVDLAVGQAPPGSRCTMCVMILHGEATGGCAHLTAAREGTA